MNNKCGIFGCRAKIKIVDENEKMIAYECSRGHYTEKPKKNEQTTKNTK